MSESILIPPEICWDRRLGLVETRILVCLFSFRSADTKLVPVCADDLMEKSGYGADAFFGAIYELIEKGWVCETDDQEYMVTEGGV